MLTGGSGNDTAVFAGDQADYTVVENRVPCQRREILCDFSNESLTQDTTAARRPQASALSLA